MALSSSSSPLNPPSATATAPRLFSNPPPTTKTPILHHFTTTTSTYPQQQNTRQQPQNNHKIAPRAPQPPPTHGILYPVASSGRGFISKPTTTADQAGTTAYVPNQVQPPFGFTFGDPQSQPLIQPTHLQQSLLGSSGAVVKGIAVSCHPKIATSPSSVSDCNGYKDIRDKTKDESYLMIRDRKVKESNDSASLYALCRSWLRNGFPEESQPRYVDSVKYLPRLLPIPVGDAHHPDKMEADNEEEDEGAMDHISPKELLQRHLKRAKRVRARLREERLQRIARCKTRLALLLPPSVEQ